MTFNTSSTSLARLKPIKTRYDQHLFRSRQEAKFAVLLNALDVPYRYEIEGFDLAGEWYLPDFWLPDADVWVEIKGIVPNLNEFTKATKLTQHGKAPTVILWSDYKFHSFLTDNLVIFVDAQDILHSERGTAPLFMSSKFWFVADVQHALMQAISYRF